MDHPAARTILNLCQRPRRFTSNVHTLFEQRWLDKLLSEHGFAVLEIKSEDPEYGWRSEGPAKARRLLALESDSPRRIAATNGFLPTA